MRGGLDLFREHKDALAAEIGKALMHAGAGGQGSHYPLFDYATSAMAVNVLDESLRAEYRAFVFEELMRARSAEGAYCDNPIMGWAPGTGLALLALNELR